MGCSASLVLTPRADASAGASSADASLPSPPSSPPASSLPASSLPGPTPGPLTRKSSSLLGVPMTTPDKALRVL